MFLCEMKYTIHDIAWHDMLIAFRRFFSYRCSLISILIPCPSLSLFRVNSIHVYLLYQITSYKVFPLVLFRVQCLHIFIQCVESFSLYLSCDKCYYFLFRSVSRCQNLVMLLSHWPSSIFYDFVGMFWDHFVLILSIATTKQSPRMNPLFLSVHLLLSAFLTTWTSSFVFTYEFSITFATCLGYAIGL